LLSSLFPAPIVLLSSLMSENTLIETVECGQLEKWTTTKIEIDENARIMFSFASLFL